MTTPTTNARPARAARRAGRRGSAYAFVLGVAMLAAMIGLTVLTGAQSAARVGGLSDDAAEARLLAQSAVAHALAAIAQDPGWRATYASATWTTSAALGRGRISFRLVDETDGILNSDPAHHVRLYGRGQCGSAVRIYSVLIAPEGLALDVLRCAAHAGGNASTNGAVSATTGALSSNATFTVGGGSVVNGDVRAAAVTNGGTVNGTITTAAAAKALPSADVFDTYLAKATEIPFASINNKSIANVLLSPAANPWGAPNGKGVYHVHVPAGEELKITNARLVATLLVTLEAGARLVTSGTWLAEPPEADFPTIVVRAAASAIVEFGGSTDRLYEATAGVNLNPPGTPYPYPGGTADINKGGSYPTRVRGVIHVIGAGAATTFGSNFTNRGAVVVQGPAAFTGGTSLAADPALYRNPPQGYTAATQMYPVGGTWRWEAAQ